MARQMYSHQQKMVDQARQAQQDSGEAVSDDNQPKPYVNLQEAAYKLAQERLSKLHEEHQRNRDYQEYYGNGKPPQPQRREQSERIRRQMSIFSSNLTKVDEQKRTKDREALLAAAQRNVRARLQGMDDKISAETGMVPPSSKSDWEAKAQMAALARHESANVNRGKIDIGGGMFMDPAAVDEIATRRVQPVLDEINEKAAIERERQELLKAEAEAKKRDEAKQKERDREIKELNRKVMGESSETSPTVDGPGTSVSRRASQGKPTVNTQREASNSDNPRSPSESGSPTNKMKEWLKSRFSRPRGRSSAGENAEDRGFVGGVALTRLANESATSLDGRSASMREVAIAGKTRVEVSNSSAGYEDSGHKARNSRDVSPVSSDSESEHFVEARDDLEGPVSPPVPIRDPGLHKSSSPTRDSRFREIIE
ncbi:hypothetical protein CH063_12308 [Colletotrichum higginsianum]|uniref:Eisosome protein 1 n=1 Tax=Colletotrichum higginsianum (strain IMI 349063) TaxID=759273 RepID=H1VPV5_COLHI|nr:hypothetical protein CH063_12308 [Colletotrichum higginsianum]